MRTKRTAAAARAAALKMLRDPYYRELRGWHFGLGAKEAMETVKNYDALIIAIEHTKPVQRLLCRLAKEAEEEGAAT
jgi:UDP-N-acetyl-D-mannosaminuronate dehydrogenase